MLAKVAVSLIVLGVVAAWWQNEKPSATLDGWDNKLPSGLTVVSIPMLAGGALLAYEYFK